MTGQDVLSLHHRHALRKVASIHPAGKHLAEKTGLGKPFATSSSAYTYTGVYDQDSVSQPISLQAEIFLNSQSRLRAFVVSNISIWEA
jgi:hypothetical protein